MEEKKQLGSLRSPLGCLDSNKDSIFKDKLVVIMGATGSGKSKLAIDISAHFPVEIINADSMQVYQGLDVLTNKVTVDEQKGVPHHLLGTVSGNTEFTAKNFKDSALPLIYAIWTRNHLPVIVGGTNYYIQALVCQFLLDDHAEHQEADIFLDDPGERGVNDSDDYSYDHLKKVDPVAANRIHPNDHRKVKQYLDMFSRFGVVPSELFQSSTMQNWGKADNLICDCCFICLDASLPALDLYVNQRVDLMVSSGLLREVFEIYKFDADYTRGLRQAIGVREFEDVLSCWNTESRSSSPGSEKFNEEMLEILNSSTENSTKLLLKEAIEKVKLNTRRLVRRQKRRVMKLQVLFNWNIHFIDVTSSLSCANENIWTTNAVNPAVDIVTSFLGKTIESVIGKSEHQEMKLAKSDLWTLHVCQACGNKELRGEHEWEQHKQGNKHRKRVSSLRKSGMLPNQTRLTTPVDR